MTSGQEKISTSGGNVVAYRFFLLTWYEFIKGLKQLFWKGVQKFVQRNSLKSNISAMTLWDWNH